MGIGMGRERKGERGGTDFPALSSQELAELIASWGSNVPLGLAEAIVARGSQVVPALCEIVSQEEWWHSEDDARSAAAVHAMHLLGAIGDASATEALLAPLEWNEPSDFMTENVPGVLARLGEAAIPALRGFVQDTSQDPILRSTVYQGLIGMGFLRPELAGQAKAIGRQVVIRSLVENEPFPHFLGLDLATYQDPSDLQLLQSAWRAKLWDDLGDLIAWADVEDAFAEGFPEYRVEHVTRDPMAYFAPEEQLRLHKMWCGAQPEDSDAGDGLDPLSDLLAGRLAIGRNALCPCGSGMKYKHCCLAKLRRKEAE